MDNVNFSNNINIKKNECGNINIKNNIKASISNSIFINNYNKNNGGAMYNNYLY